MDARQAYAIKHNSLQPTEYIIINFYELSYFGSQKIPTTTEVIEYVNRKFEKEGKKHRLTYSALNYYMQRAVFIRALEKRGIPFRQHTQEELTPQQQAAALTVMNFADQRTNKEKLDQLGINEAQYYAWLNDPAFKALCAELEQNNKQNIRPIAVTEFAKKIHGGDWQAIKYYLEITGAAQDNETPQTEQLLRTLIEVIQKHVKDPAVISAIAQDIKLAAQNRTLTVVNAPHEILDGSVVSENDVELEYAKKQLGIG